MLSPIMPPSPPALPATGGVLAKVWHAKPAVDLNTIPIHMTQVGSPVALVLLSILLFLFFLSSVLLFLPVGAPKHPEDGPGRRADLLPW